MSTPTTEITFREINGTWSYSYRGIETMGFDSLTEASEYFTATHPDVPARSTTPTWGVIGRPCEECGSSNPRHACPAVTATYA